MSGVSLDTSGSVAAYPWEGGEIAPQVRWDQLLPIEQGYVEAMFADEAQHEDGWSLARRGWAFHHLAPETLAAIRKDCAFLATLYATTPTANEGQIAWDMRQAGKFLQFPKMVEAGVAEPLTVTLGDDGKVRIAPVDGATDRSSRSGRTQP